jgi:hypothetical protein
VSLIQPGYVYFQADLQPGAIYIGWTEEPVKRDRAHRREGRELLAILRAGKAEEGQLHAAFAALRIEGRPSVYHGDRVWDFVAWLQARGYAVKDLATVGHLPVLPYEVWRPERAGSPWEEPSGQLSLASQMDRRERTSRVSELVHLSSDTDEWLTPPQVIDRARKAMGGIDTDPASCAKANGWIGARIWYSRQIDGLNPQHPWEGNVWLNPPYGRGQYAASAFCARLIQERQAGTVAAAITCLNLNSAGSNWFDQLWMHASRHLVWRGRIDFIRPDGEPNGSSPSKGTILSYFGENPAAFDAQFQDVGTLVAVIQRWKEAQPIAS